MITTQCPICSENKYLSVRYPNSVCSECVCEAVTEKGDQITFHNKNLQGGFISIVNNVEDEIHNCYIKNIPCIAEEARFGGIIVQVVKNQN